MQPHTLARRDIERRLADVERAWAPRNGTAADGLDAGRKFVELSALGGLSVRVEVEQFLDLGRAEWQGTPISFTPPASSRGDTSWLRRWGGGLLTTCGLRTVGPDRLGDMHGRAAGIPATVTTASGAWEGDRYVLRVEGRMREGALFDQNFTVERSITATVGEPEIRIRDVIRNESFTEDELRVLYHVNFGWPLVDDGAELLLDALRPDGSAFEAGRIGPPVDGASEKATILRARAGRTGWASATLIGHEAQASLSWRPDQLPAFTLWRSEVSGGYAIGIEPGTCWPSHLAGPDAPAHGVTLTAGSTHVIDLVLRFSETARDLRPADEFPVERAYGRGTGPTFPRMTEGDEQPVMKNQ